MTASAAAPAPGMLETIATALFCVVVGAIVLGLAVVAAMFYVLGLIAYGILRAVFRL